MRLKGSVPKCEAELNANALFLQISYYKIMAETLRAQQ
jgi:hypothetical protein